MRRWSLFIFDRSRFALRSIMYCTRYQISKAMLFLFFFVCCCCLSSLLSIVCLLLSRSFYERFLSPVTCKEYLSACCLLGLCSYVVVCVICAGALPSLEPEVRPATWGMFVRRHADAAMAVSTHTRSWMCLFFYIHAFRKFTHRAR